MDLPFTKTVDDYDFNFQPSVNKKEIEDFMSLRFIENNENILFIGSSKVGKTHLKTAIGIKQPKTDMSQIKKTDQNSKSIFSINIVEVCTKINDNHNKLEFEN